MLPSTVNGTDLGEQERRNYLFLRYGIEPSNLTSHCDGCGAAFTIRHTLDCKKVVLVTAHHSELRDGVADLAGKTFYPAHVRDNPKIFTGCAVLGGRPNPRAEQQQRASMQRRRRRGRRTGAL